MSRQTKSQTVPRTTALCYVRQSYTRDGNDMTSPERQRANIETVCTRNGWKPEWYQDTEGHKSGRQEKNRPNWLALKARLGDPDVAALVANDLARLHRKGWRVGDLLDFIEEHDVRLVLASPSSPVADLSSIQGRMMMQIAAMFDEWYAADLSQRQKDSIIFRKSRGKVIGQVPPGTMRNQDGYLIPSTEGAWSMPDGSFQKGTPDQPPDPAAHWHFYYETTKRILMAYVENTMGAERIAFEMQIEGWPFRDRNGEPRRVERDDVRRLVANWPEYGGIITLKRSKDRHPLTQDLENIPFNSERAVFDLDLLRRVAEVRRDRTIEAVNYGVVTAAKTYALNNVVYCAHCERLAAEQNNPKLRTRLSGNNSYNTFRYRHKEGVRCGAKNRSVLCSDIEADFLRLIKLLTVREDAIGLMTELAIQADKLSRPNTGEAVDPEAEKREAIALCKRRIEAAVNLYGDGRLQRDEYLRRVEANEHEITHWEARTSDIEKAALELAMCMEAVDKLSKLWEMGEDDDRAGMSKSLFSYVVWDLDIRRIVDFKLKPWADRFLVLRASLYEDNDGSTEGGNENASAVKELRQGTPLRGFEPRF